jgi:hypothetical protein
MGYRLAPGVSFCQADNRFFFLDVRRDRYVCLGTAAARVFERIIEGEAVEATNLAALEGLTRNGLLIETADDEQPLHCPVPQPARSSLLDIDAPTSIGDVIHALIDWQATRAQLRIIGFNRVLGRLRRAKRRPQQANRQADAARIAAAFAGSGFAATTHDHCLPIAIAVTHRLVQARFNANLVIGIMARPFGAHSWAQVGDQIVTDRIDAIRPFVPILVI